MSGVLAQPLPSRSHPPLVRRLLSLLAFAVAGCGVGAASGALWWRVVKLPRYQVGSDGGAFTSERGLTEFVGGDAWFTLIGLVGGALVGLAAWKLFSSLGWMVVVVATVVATGAALTCWAVGYHLGPGD
ncbi:MAG: hypothetical protein QOE64_1152, partial [Frankiales bacterium]|nr:hypothetical protein [Frankiales bacterium]